ncbi:hemerythrin domain-containing protein [Pseudoramibacter sp. HA2172]|uniref:hemerythrin domain-containing protein n=1 Tax=Pseudoramibacter faecis TaxID=3108534 RepID=UPI002E79A881|nr:hemerythrin domain-containing protein [Pseudoramibacter sp. HA2172]
MYSVDVMKAEHDNILEFLKVVRSMCCQVVAGGDLVTDDFRQVVDFARNYSDAQHHGKEEHFLFNEMEARLGPVGVNLIRHGMLVEHNLCRGHMFDLTTALDQYEADPDIQTKVDIVEAANGYATLLTRHIAKENTVVYPFGEKNLDAAVLAQIDDKVRAFEAQTTEVPERYLAMLERLRERYGSVDDRHQDVVITPTASKVKID